MMIRRPPPARRGEIAGRQPAAAGGEPFLAVVPPLPRARVEAVVGEVLVAGGMCVLCLGGYISVGRWAVCVLF